MANYGDVALNLPADWNRRKLTDQRFALLTVGHQDGIADARLKDHPDELHQFAWVMPTFKGLPNDEVDVNRTKGYKFVKKTDGWEKNENLWEWDAEGYCTFQGQRLMARPAELFFADMAERRATRDRVMGTNADEEQAHRLAAKHGIQISGEEDGKPIKRRRSA